jgi:predicted O-methyltransferase YrrM
MTKIRTILISVLIIATAMLALAQRRFGGRYSDSSNPPLGNTEAEKKILEVLDTMVKSGSLFANVPQSDGRLLRLLAEATGAKSVVELGTSTGYSGLWFSIALLKTGGKLTTFEIDPDRAATARKHFQAAGVTQMITIVEGDAHQTISRLKDPIDMVFIDADKEGYEDYLNKLLPLVRPGGLILAHNVEMSGNAFVKAVTTNPGLETLFYSPGSGLSITLKKR